MQQDDNSREDEPVFLDTPLHQIPAPRLQRPARGLLPAQVWCSSFEIDCAYRACRDVGSFSKTHPRNQ